MSQSPDSHLGHSSREALPELDDPVYLNGRREALVILGLWALAMIYALTVCYFLGYDRDPATLTYIVGIPDWVFYGVILPWIFCDLFTVWFCFRFMKEDDLGTEEGSPLQTSAVTERPTDEV